MCSQQQNSTIVGNSYKEFIEWKKDVCFKIALFKNHNRYKTTLDINKVNKKFQELMNRTSTPESILRLEQIEFEEI